MIRFYLRLWLFWFFQVSALSLGAAALADAVVTAALYVYRGAPPLNASVAEALWEIAGFWFGILWSLTLLWALFISVRRIMERCYAHRKFILLTCKGDERITPVGHGDIVTLWRRWMMLLIWLVAAQMILMTGIRMVFGFETALDTWFDSYWLYGALMIAGGISLPLLGTRCKRIRVSQC